MSGWSDFSALAKTALLTAQKKIDKALEIDDDGLEEETESTIDKQPQGAFLYIIDLFHTL